MRDWLHRCWLTLTTIPPVDLIDPPSADDRANAARADQGERLRRRGLSEIMRVSQADVVNLADRRKLLEAIMAYRSTH